MKKTIILASIAFATAFYTQADPAKKVNLTFQNGKLKIEAIHGVKDVKTHYIDQIIINVDGKDVKTISPKFQSSKGAETLEIAVAEIKKGSNVVVTTRCNEFGKKKGKLTVK